MGEILEASDGSIWCTGGFNGVSRFDGKDWHTYTQDNGSTKSPIYSLWQTHDGTVWAGGKQVIRRFEGENWTTYDSEAIPFWIDKEGGFDASSIVKGLSAKDGSIWFTNLRARHAFRFDPRGTWTKYTHPDGLFGGYETNDGSIWFHTQKQAVQLKEGHWLAHTPADGFLNGNTLGMTRTSDDVLWFFGMHNGVQSLAQFRAGRWQIYTPQDGTIDTFLNGEGIFQFPYHLPVEKPIETPDGDCWFFGQHERALVWVSFSAGCRCGAI